MGIDRELVIRTITGLIADRLSSKGDWERRGELTLGGRIAVDESILTLMRVADEVGLYAEVDRRIVIPPYLKARYRAPRRPTPPAARPASSSDGAT